MVVSCDKKYICVISISKNRTLEPKVEPEFSDQDHQTKSW